MTLMIPMLTLGAQELIIIAGIILLLFGGAKLPSLMRGLGKGVKEFKDATNGITDEKKDEKEEQKKD